MALNRVTITLNSRQYTVVAEESTEYIQKLCNHINEKVSEVRKGGQNILGERPVILAALNICDEYYKALDESKALKEEIEAYKLQIERLQRASQISIGDTNRQTNTAPQNNNKFNHQNRKA